FWRVNKLLEAPVKDQEQGIKVTEESCPLQTVRTTVRVWDEKVTALSRDRRGHWFSCCARWWYFQEAPGPWLIGQSELPFAGQKWYLQVFQKGFYGGSYYYR